MPELPEISARAVEMKAALAGKTIAGVEVLQPKCLNLSPETFGDMLGGAIIQDVTHRGKWLFCQTSRGWLLINLGMGGELLLVTRSSMPAKYRLVFDFTDGSCLAVNFWWFGYVHYVPTAGLDQHQMTAKLGANALDLSLDDFKAMFIGQRARVKALLLDQSRIAGIGNAYIHDILFMARLHPLRPANSLSESEVEALWRAVRDGLLPSLEKGGAFYELNLRGEKGGFTLDDIVIGYKEGKPCPVCSAPIEKIKTGSTASFICPYCQPLAG